ncbi:hypothetical protein GALMADRAFT_716116 [Galerina marginata CBS 339.88]|uniref:Uncharacterized protein n=1 Tax=Galerina marginata (strain CBS 339.88) TaxID=685588 RepID=A0A067TMT2_GALM3|nr:hypothetical protein GALMADRAFT_716116 [Galerina marginata CBS 339.88]
MIVNKQRKRKDLPRHHKIDHNQQLRSPTRSHSAQTTNSNCLLDPPTDSKPKLEQKYNSSFRTRSFYVYGVSATEAGSKLGYSRLDATSGQGRDSQVKISFLKR